MKNSIPLKRLGKFYADETGTASVEALIWVPIFMFFLVLVLDVSFIFFGRAEALRVVQDGNRAFSIGVLADREETEEFIKNGLRVQAPSSTVDTILIDDIIVETTAMIPARELMVVGSIPVFQSVTIAVTARHFLER